MVDSYYLQFAFSRKYCSLKATQGSIDKRIEIFQRTEIERDRYIVAIGSLAIPYRLGKLYRSLRFLCFGISIWRPVIIVGNSGPRGP